MGKSEKQVARQFTEVDKKDSVWSPLYGENRQGNSNRGINPEYLMGLVADAYNEDLENRLAV